jgi:hypothetical protein
MATHQPAPSRWVEDPERMDPDDYPPGSPFVKLMTWAPCPACDLQVHTPLTRFLLQGIDCPSCKARLISPPDDAPEGLTRALRWEDQLSEQLG